jgi:hypothetical protein
VDTAVLIEIEGLRRASMANLREKYLKVFGEETRCRHREHLFRRIAWRLQALAEGDLSERARGRVIAVAATGTRWNGLAFFGLTRRAGVQRKERPRAKK